MQRYRIIMDSMTAAEMDDPSVIGSSRIQRIARGAGASPEEVRALLRYYKMKNSPLNGVRGGQGRFNMQRMLKKFGGGT